MRSGHAMRAVAPVLAAGVGIRYSSGWAIRSASFRLDHDCLALDDAIRHETTRGASLGIAASRPASSSGLIDRLGLTGWADVPVRSAPDLIVRKARLAAAAVHQPSLLLIDGLLDNLPAADLAILAEVIHTLERDATVVASERSPEVLMQACHKVLVLADGILIDCRAPSQPASQPELLCAHGPAYRD